MFSVLLQSQTGSRASAENFPGEGDNGKKNLKLVKKYRKIALFAFSSGAHRKKKTEK